MISFVKVPLFQSSDLDCQSSLFQFTFSSFQFSSGFDLGRDHIDFIPVDGFGRF